MDDALLITSNEIMRFNDLQILNDLVEYELGKTILDIVLI